MHYIINIMKYKWIIATNHLRNGSFNLLNVSGDILLHFNPRPNANQVVVNSKIDNQWKANALCIPFPHYHPCLLGNVRLHAEIEVDEFEGFFIKVENDPTIYNYPHSIPWSSFQGNVFVDHHSEQMYDSHWIVTSNYKRSSKKALVLLCYKPSHVWFQFLNQFTSHDTYVVIDDNTTDYKTLYSQYKHVHILQCDDTISKSKGYQNSSVNLPKPITAWDKAFYFFCETTAEKYDHVWFLEEDVFVYNEQTLETINTQYPTSDLICNQILSKLNERNRWKWWHLIDKYFQSELHRGMVCACRLSKQMLIYVQKFVLAHNTLSFIECLIPTLAKQYYCEIHSPLEMSNLVYRYTWDATNVNTKTQLYHPLKNLESHEYIRQKM